MPARSLTGRASQVAVGIVAVIGGPTQMALRVGEDGEPVLLPPVAMAELISNARFVLAQKIAEERR
ncbi:hypothetical protein GCM10023192_14760 [Amycolatopsis samaneae]